MSDGTTTIRYSEYKPIPFDYKSPLGTVLTITSATVTLYNSDGTVVFSNRAVNNIIVLTPSTSRAYLTLQPLAEGLTAGNTYSATCKAVLTAVSPLGTYGSPGLECVVSFEVLFDWE